MPIAQNLESSGELLFDFGRQPVSNRFLTDKSDNVPSFPLQLRVELDTGLIHQGKPFPVEELKPRYDWLTCFEPEDHLDDLALKLTRLPGVSKSSRFGAYSFKDDSTLARLAALGYDHQWRIDPVQDLGVNDPCANVETYQQALTLERACQIRERRGAADVMIVRHVIEHAYDLTAFIAAIRSMVSPGGYIVWELPDCERALERGDCTTIWEEHLFYFTGFTFRQMLLKAGFTIAYYDSVNYPLENSLVAIVRDAPATEVIASPDPAELEREIARARNFVQAVSGRRSRLRNKLEAIRAQHGPVAIFGAGHLSAAFLSLMQVSDLISCVVDDNPNKKGLVMPVGGLEIVGSDALYSGDIGVCLLGLNPQNQPKVIAKYQRFVGQGGIFASVFPGSELDLESVE
jgi:hypothetical protein